MVDLFKQRAGFLGKKILLHKNELNYIECNFGLYGKQSFYCSNSSLHKDSRRPAFPYSSFNKSYKNKYYLKMKAGEKQNRNQY